MSTVQTVFLVSDGTGETGGRFLAAALHQFAQGKDVNVTKYTHMASVSDIEGVIRDAESIQPLILHTIVRDDLRLLLGRLCLETGVANLDLIGPLLDTLSQFLSAPSQGESGKLHKVDDWYFKRMEAIEFTLQHDDGRITRGLSQAEIILLGVSRSSKTPTSVYLAQEGYKVVNIPIVLGQLLPEALFRVPPQRVVGLTLDPHRLKEIRLQRMARMGTSPGDAVDYADLATIEKELAWASKLFSRNKQWKLIDVTSRSIEETAREILDMIYGRTRPILPA